MAISNQQAVALLRKYPVPVACILICLGLIFFAYYRMDEIASSESKLQDRTLYAERLLQNIKNANQLKQQVDALSAAQSKIDGRLLRASSLASNLQYFYKLETETGIKLLDLRQGIIDPENKAKKTASYITIPFTVTVEGDFSHLLSFLRSLEYSPHFCSFQSVVIASAPVASGVSEDGAPLMQLSLRIEFLGTK